MHFALDIHQQTYNKYNTYTSSTCLNEFIWNKIINYKILMKRVRIKGIMMSKYRTEQIKRSQIVRQFPIEKEFSSSFFFIFFFIFFDFDRVIIHCSESFQINSSSRYKRDMKNGRLSDLTGSSAVSSFNLNTIEIMHQFRLNIHR